MQAARALERLLKNSNFMLLESGQKLHPGLALDLLLQGSSLLERNPSVFSVADIEGIRQTLQVAHVPLVEQLNSGRIPSAFTPDNALTFSLPWAERRGGVGFNFQSADESVCTERQNVGLSSTTSLDIEFLAGDDVEV